MLLLPLRTANPPGAAAQAAAAPHHQREFGAQTRFWFLARAPLPSAKVPIIELPGDEKLRLADSLITCEWALKKDEPAEERELPVGPPAVAACATLQADLRDGGFFGGARPATADFMGLAMDRATGRH
uniref:GST N-terminal domain-containing protein n=1 Tax=Macrostomum lignano TaxID=282301 RepID=A0A1I8FDC6_9PLAT